MSQDSDWDAWHARHPMMSNDRKRKENKMAHEKHTPTQGNFILYGKEGERIAVFATEAEMHAFREIKALKRERDALLTEMAAGERWLDGGHPGYIEQAKKLARKALALCEEGLTIEAWRRANATVLRRRARYPQHGNLYHVLASHGKDAWELGILLRTTGGRDFYIATSTPDRSVPAIWRVFPSRRAHRHAAYLGIQG